MSAHDSEPRANQDGGGLVKVPQDFAAGLFLIAVAAIGYFGAFALKTGTLGGMGPGLLPKAVSLVLGAFGLLLIVESLTAPGVFLERWSLRGPVFVLGAAIVFALTVRPLGLVVAGPLAVFIAACADKSSRIIEVLVFAAVMTALSIGLFKYLLNLPIPLAPWYLGY